MFKWRKRNKATRRFKPKIVDRMLVTILKIAWLERVARFALYESLLSYTRLLYGELERVMLQIESGSKSSKVSYF